MSHTFVATLCLLATLACAKEEGIPVHHLDFNVSDTLSLSFTFANTSFSFRMNKETDLFGDEAVMVHSGDQQAVPLAGGSHSIYRSFKCNHDAQASILVGHDEGTVSGTILHDGAIWDLQLVEDSNIIPSYQVAVVHTDMTPARQLGNYAGVQCGHSDGAVRYMDIGVVVDRQLYQSMNSRTSRVSSYVGSIVSAANLMFEAQLGVSVRVAQLYVQNSAPASGSLTSFLGSCASSSIRDHHDSMQAWVDEEYADIRSGTNTLNRQVAWVALTSCTFTENLGIAATGAYCRDQATMSMTANENRVRVFAHELGHILGAGHFRGVGGVMDDTSNSGAYANLLQFHPVSLSSMCRALDHMVNYWNCPFFSIKNTSCGDGVLSAGEECECEKGSTSCLFCNRCQLQSGKECTPQGLPSTTQCCTAEGTLLDSTNTCTISWGTHTGVTGQCVNGECRTQCGVRGNCGSTGYARDGCMSTCYFNEASTACSRSYFPFMSPVYVGQLPDGTRCANSGTCDSGYCVNQIEPTPNPTTSPPTTTDPPTPPPVSSEEEPDLISFCKARTKKKKCKKRTQGLCKWGGRALKCIPK